MTIADRHEKGGSERNRRATATQSNAQGERERDAHCVHTERMRARRVEVAKLSVAKPDWSSGTWLAVDPWLHY